MCLQIRRGYATSLRSDILQSLKTHLNVLQLPQMLGAINAFNAGVQR